MAWLIAFVAYMAFVLLVAKFCGVNNDEPNR